ncbi:MAG: sigma-70 family RNA polymerase sigma factor [Pseudomonadaceae bacterium]|nr:sigma-70 family RNA polymerase sigma factor [Pseudomonadaceae bacterium]
MHTKSDKPVSSRQALNDGDRFERWLAQHGALIERICRLYGRTIEERDDLRQDIHLAIWRSLATYRGDASEVTWIYRVALNVALSAERKRSPEADDTDVDELPATARDDDSRRQWLYARLRELTPADRSLAVLVLDGNSYADISEVLGISVSNVGVRINRLKGKLKKVLGEQA